MAIKNLNPYLMFNGNAGQAIERYERALGAVVEARQRYADAPGDTPAELGDRVIHACLRIGGGTIMISDSMPDQPVAAGGNVEVCLHFEDVEDMKKRFDALAAGGKVTMPVQETFWNATFGTLTDAFGVRWMFNCDKKG